MNKLSYDIKKNIRDLILCGIKNPTTGEVECVSWCGKLGETTFLKRLYDLEKLPSYDRRYSNAFGDISCHVSWDDYEDGWVFEDQRFGVMNTNDETFLNFVCEVFHPAVSIESVEDKKYVEYYLFNEIKKLLKVGGYDLFEENRLADKPVIRWKEVPDQNIVIDEQIQALKDAFNSEYIHCQIEQMWSSIGAYPSDAIGKAKELVESCCKTILEESGITIDKDWDVPRLAKETFELLSLLPNSLDDNIQGVGTIKRLLGNLCSIPSGLAELRNSYGTGHGKADSFISLSQRHARLAVGAASTLCWFLWDTYQESKTRQDDY